MGGSAAGTSAAAKAGMNKLILALGLALGFAGRAKAASPKERVSLSSIANVKQHVLEGAVNPIGSAEAQSRTARVIAQALSTSPGSFRRIKLPASHGASRTAYVTHRWVDGLKFNTAYIRNVSPAGAHIEGTVELPAHTHPDYEPSHGGF